MHTNGELQLPPSIPNVESGEGFQTNGEWQTKPSAVPKVESRGTAQGWGFAPGEFQSERLGAWFQASPLPAQLSPELNHLPAQANLPSKGKPVRSILIILSMSF